MRNNLKREMETDRDWERFKKRALNHRLDEALSGTAIMLLWILLGAGAFKESRDEIRRRN